MPGATLKTHAQQLVLNLLEYFELEKINGGPLESVSYVQEIRKRYFRQVVDTQEQEPAPSATSFDSDTQGKIKTSFDSDPDTPGRIKTSFGSDPDTPAKIKTAFDIDPDTPGKIKTSFDSNPDTPGKMNFNRELFKKMRKNQAKIEKTAFDSDPDTQAKMNFKRELFKQVRKNQAKTKKIRVLAQSAKRYKKKVVALKEILRNLQSEMETPLRSRSFDGKELRNATFRIERDIFPDNPFSLSNNECGEISVLDFTKMDITDISEICRGCLGTKNVADMDSNVCGTNICRLYEELTETKMDASSVPARMCTDCVLLLSKTDQFIKMLKHSHRVLDKAAQEIESFKNIQFTELDRYTFKKLSVLQSVLQEKYLVAESRNADDIQTNVLSEDQELNHFSDNEDFDSLSVHNETSTSDDEIPLAERFKIDINKAATSFKKSVAKRTSKVSKTRHKKTKENIESVCDGNSICPMCLKNCSYLPKHLETVHSVDWLNTKCLKCLYENVNKEQLIEHCKECIKEEEIVIDDVKEEWNDEMNDRNHDPDFELENQDGEDLRDIEYATKEVIDRKKRGRPMNRKKKYRFECNRCEEAFMNYKEIETHFKLIHSKESTCIVCDLEYNNAFSLLYHMMVKHGKLKCCRLCLVSFKNTDELNRHYKSEEHNTKCTVCGEQFKNRKALYEHRRKKHLNPQLENLKYKCPECPKEFANQNNIRRHIMVAHNDLRFLCDTCGQSYTTKRNLKLHIAKFHEGLKVETKNTKKNFFCEACGRELKIFHKYAIAMHRAKHKGHNFVCKRCYETFATEETFKSHVETFGHQLLECHKCQAQFVREENFKIHLKNHDAPGWNKNMFATWGKSAKLRNDKGEFVCSYCPKVFKDKQRLDNHIRVHTNERPYKCHICSKGFKTWIHRKTHLNIHLGIKKWVCKFCAKAFTNSCTLKGHEMIHTGERPHRCPECKKGFITMSAMKKHRMVHFRSGSSNYGKKANQILKDEDKTESDNEVNAEFAYKYGQMFTGSDGSYEGYVEPPKAEPVRLVSIEKELTC